MKIKTLIVALIAAAICYLPSPICSAASPYAQGEATVDVFGTYSQSKAKLNDAFDREFKNGTYGGGLGFNYFFHRNFALGVDAIVATPSHSFFDQANLNLTARMPIGDSAFAPYLTGGVGRNLESGEYTSHTGFGLECRVTTAISVVIEGRYTWGSHDADTAQARAGLRFKF